MDSREQKRTIEATDTSTSDLGYNHRPFWSYLERHEIDQTYKEILLVCHSEERGAKENSILAIFKNRFEREFGDLHTNLSHLYTVVFQIISA